MIPTQNKDKMGSRTLQKIDKSTLDSMVLSAYSNMVLIKIPNFLEERKSAAGIILDVNPDIQYFDEGDGSHMADLALYTGIIEKVPPGLRPDGDLLPWNTDMALKIGDVVFFDYYDGLHATSFVIGDDEYRLLPYASCYACIRDSQGDSLICLNGYVLFEEVFLPENKYSTERKVDPGKGKIYALGNPVVHNNNYWDDGIEITVGDIVVFRKKYPRVYLERVSYFQQLDKKLFKAQRKDINFSYGKDM